MAQAEMTRTPPGLMFGPAWRAGPSWIVSTAPGKGPGSHLGLISPEPLRLLWNCNWGLLLLLWSAESDPRPQTGTTPGKYHIYSQRGNAAGLTAGSGSALCSLRQDQGSAGLGRGLGWRHRKQWHRKWPEAAAPARAVGALNLALGTVVS